MEPGFAWNKVHDGTQSAFGLWSILFGIAAETLYLPCMLALRQEKNSCFRVSILVIRENIFPYYLIIPPT